MNEKTLALNHHKTFLSSSNLRSRNEDPHSNRHREETGTTPLFSGIVLDGVQANIFKQYGLLGEQVVNTGPVGQGCYDFDKQRPLSPTEDDPRIFVNVSPPWFAFICGSQGSGKSHTLSCILENCLIPSKHLDLSTMTIVHRFTSPEWFRTLGDHLAGVTMLRDIKSGEAGVKRDVARIFAEIVGLGVGESLLFSPTAMLNGIVAAEDVDVNDKRKEVMQRMEVLPEKLGTEWVKMRIRRRLTKDGGRSRMAV